MAKKDLTKKDKQNSAVKLWNNRGPRYMEMIDDFIVENFNDEDKDMRRDAHKLLGKVFDANISKAALVTKNETDPNAFPNKFQQALNAYIQQNPAMIEVEEAELVNPTLPEEEALKIRNATRK
ncbi:MAG: hypothetical protein GY861_12035 [bacterium]|nr:hypothetical protein [bacterium]